MLLVVGFNLCVNVSRYDQASAQVKAMEKQATRLSGEARDESKMSNSLLKDIDDMERNVPSALEVTAPTLEKINVKHEATDQRV